MNEVAAAVTPVPPSEVSTGKFSSSSRMVTIDPGGNIVPRGEAACPVCDASRATPTSVRDRRSSRDESTACANAGAATARPAARTNDDTVCMGTPLFLARRRAALLNAQSTTTPA